MKSKFNTLSNRMCLLTAFALSNGIASAQNQALPDINDPRAFIVRVSPQVTAGAPRLLGNSYYIGSGSSLIAKDSIALSYVTPTGTLISQQNTYKYGSGTWSPDLQYTYTYDNSGLNTQTTYKLWNGSQHVFANIGRYTYNYDASNYKTNMLLEFWSPVSSGYVNGFKETYVSNANGGVTDILQQDWTAASTLWTNRLHTTNVYNAQGQVTDNILQYWNSNSNIWINKTRITYAYDATGRNLVSSTIFNWDGSTNSWINTQRTSNTLNAGGKVQIGTIELYNGMNSAWDKYQRETNSYNATGYLTTDVKEMWDMSTNAYVNATKAGYSYNSHNQVTVTDVRSWVSGAWGVDGNANRLHNYYDVNELGIAKTAVLNLSVSPVPASDMLTIVGKLNVVQDVVATVVNMAGSTVRQYSFKNAKEMHESISVSDMPAGSYVLSVRGNSGEMGTKGFVVVH